ncbi:hypothetical protein WJX72_012140 [[Myrmecia] bisecta]|uniref:Bromodomain-containing protein n=1 Tax=[Myrmecia] bisecta TaxID=41462 RepID=A0AAW1QGS1_9CHLO
MNGDGRGGLLRQQNAHLFAKPVDAVALKCPDYYTVIKHPMDLGTVNERLGSRKIPRIYSTIYEFRDDMRQIWTNCRLYNQVGSAVRMMGETLSDNWEKKWVQAGLEAKWEAEMEQQRAEDMELAGVQLPEAARRMRDMDRELRSLQRQAEARTGPLPPDPSRDMTLEEKRKLSQQLGSLPGERLERVMDIIAQGTFQLEGQDEGEELELDMDSLDRDTLWRLSSYASSVLKSGERVPTSNGVAGPPAAKHHEQETSSRPSAGGQQPEAHAPHDMQPGDASPAHPPADRPANSTSTSSSGSSGSESGSAGEAGSKENEGSSFPADQTKAVSMAGEGHDGQTLVSGTQPPAPAQHQIIKNMAQKKEVTLQNANAWADLTAGEGAAAGPGPGAEGEEEEEEEDGNNTQLWTQFKSREEQQRKRDEEKKVEEERIRRETEAAEEAARRAAERHKAEAEAAVAEQKRLEEERAEQERRQIEEQRQKELAQLENIQKPEDFASTDLMKHFSAPGGADQLAALGMHREEDDDDDFGGDEPADMEEGEV